MTGTGHRLFDIHDSVCPIAFAGQRRLSLGFRLIVDNFFCQFLDKFAAEDYEAFVFLALLGFEGAYDRDNRFVGRWQTADAFLKLGGWCCVL
jgi:hypothetical protein